MEVEVVQTFGMKSAGGAISGQKAVTTAGTAVALGTGKVKCALMVKAKPANTGYIYLGNDGADDVTSANGIILSAGDSVIFAYVEELADIYVDSSVSADGVGWIALEVR